MLSQVNIEEPMLSDLSNDPQLPVQPQQSAPALTIHHLDNSRSQRLFWLLEELELPYEVKNYKRGPDQRAPKELVEVHPLGKSPIITDGDLTLAESGAIVEYILQKYGGTKLQPSGDAAKVTDLYYTHYSEGSLMPLLVNKIIFSIIPQKSPIFVRPLLKSVFQKVEKVLLHPELKKHIELIEAHLKKQTSGWFAGEEHPTASDFMMTFPLELLILQSSKTSATGGDMPEIRKYLKRIHERPAYKKAMEKAGETYYAEV
ncbi:hypothetical protein Clacol_004483 [Clathrus columnatus]|uniref:glutathione transferase n=1 Tax=Clathrus columnatus TaxID=1419009 RepID=A0AAV5A9L0_9AGAM|nr:hypothetical protein Clacol_004483 [Clathrus columnatus]